MYHFAENDILYQFNKTNRTGVMARQVHKLGSWQLAEAGFQLRPDRRAVMNSIIVAGAAAAAGIFGAKSAAALTVEHTPPAVLGAIAERPGVLPWRTLALVDAEYGQPPRFPEALQKLDGRPATIEGHVMPMEEGDAFTRFLLTAYNAHCAFCMSGGWASIVAVRARKPVTLKNTTITLHGTLRLLSERGSNLLYRLEGAILAA